MNLTKLYAWFGGFGEFCTVVCLVSAIVLAFTGKLTGSYAAAISAVGGWGVIHDQLTDYQRDHAPKNEG
jgi:hypothetical protein